MEEIGKWEMVPLFRAASELVWRETDRHRLCRHCILLNKVQCGVVLIHCMPLFIKLCDHYSLGGGLACCGWVGQSVKEEVQWHTKVVSYLNVHKKARSQAVPVNLKKWRVEGKPAWYPHGGLGSPVSFCWADQPPKWWRWHKGMEPVPTYSSLDSSQYKFAMDGQVYTCSGLYIVYAACKPV